MSDLITDAMVEVAAVVLRNQLRARVGLSPLDRLPWSPASDEVRGDARAALEAAAPAIAAKAWDEGYAMSERELDHAYGGHPISQDGPCDMCHECGTGNPYRSDRIERGES